MIWLLIAIACTPDVEDFPRSSTPLGVGAHNAPPDEGKDTGDDTGDDGTGDDDTGDTSED